MSPFALARVALYPRHESLDHPPAVKRSTAVFDSGTEGCLRQPQATRGQVLRGIKPPAAFGGRLFIREALDGAAADRLELGGCVRREASTAFRLATIYRTKKYCQMHHIANSQAEVSFPGMPSTEREGRSTNLLDLFHECGVCAFWPE